MSATTLPRTAASDALAALLGVSLAHAALTALADAGLRIMAAPPARRGARVHDFDTYTAARRAAFQAAGLSCQDDVGCFFAYTVWARVPATWANCKIFGGTKHGPRDVRVPIARYWLGGVFPAGMIVADDPALAQAAD